MADVETVVAAGDVTEPVAPQVNAEEPEKQTDPQATENEGEQKPKKLGGWQRKQLKAEAEAEYWRNVALETLAKQPKAEEPKEVEDKRPRKQDFVVDQDAGTYDSDKYEDALLDWKHRQSMKEFNATLDKREKERTQKTQAEQAAETWREKEAAFVKENPDYEENSVVADQFIRGNQKSQSVQAIGGAIGESEIGPALLNYLGENYEELQRIAKLSPIRAIAEIGKIEAKLAQEPPEPEQEADKPAPAPVPREPKPKPPQIVKKQAPADDGELRDDLSPEEWSRRYLKKLEKR
jgi:hypothetical protein